MRFQVLALLALSALLVACSPPPAWQPGDQPLVIAIEDGGAQWAAQTACERWAIVGLECTFVREHDPADVHWRILSGEADCKPGHTCAATTEYFWGPSGWSYFTELEPNTAAGMGR